MQKTGYIVRIFLVACLMMVVLSSSTLATTKNSDEFNIQGTQWLNNGKKMVFDGQKTGKFIAGKFYPTRPSGDGSLRFDFYNADGVLVLTRSLRTFSVPENQPFVSYHFDLDKNSLKGEYTVKVTADYSTWGWINY